MRKSKITKKSAMKQLLIAYHSQTGNTKQLVNAAYQAAKQCGEPIKIIKRHAAKISVMDMQTADAYLFATPENFGYMSGELKALFDRTYEQSREQTAGKTYALLIACGNDGSGAKAAVERILIGYNMKNSGLCVINQGDISESALQQAHDVGTYLAVALANGVI